MSFEDKDEDQRLALGIVGGIVGVVVASVLAFGAYVGVTSGEKKAAPAPVAAPVAAAPAAAQTYGASADGSKIVVQNGVVKFYFASGKADLAKGANEALAQVVAGLKAGQKAQISGYHDATGSLAANQELAKRRSISVRDALVAMGAPVDKVELKKPENSAGTGDNTEARRVEVTLVK